ncbi:hypothetical protein [Pedobacter sp. CAN_A7]|uniref:hypothetical protein n=1 Tax=Pedobacter sp. CAN_A7 TaxID=2787722 RepID=UPI0018CBDA41
MYSKNKHISRCLSVLLLLVFTIALTPWNALHHHPEVVVHQEVEKSCTHELHLSSHVDSCLVCEAHFVKDFVNSTATFQVFISTTSCLIVNPSLRSSYTELVHTSLRGPPAATA